LQEAPALLVEAKSGQSKLLMLRTGDAMNPLESSWDYRAIEAFVARIDEMVVLHNSPENMHDEMGEHIAQHGKVLFIGAPLRPAFDGAVAILQKKYGHRRSRVALRSRLATLLISYRGNGDGISLVDAMAVELDNERFDLTVTLPLQGIEIFGDVALDFGPIELRQFDDELFDERVIAPLKRIVHASAMADDKKADALKHQLEYAAPMRHAVCVTFQSHVDRDLTLELLSQQTLPVVDYLQFCASILSPPSWRHVVEFRGDYTHHTFLPAVLLSADGFTVLNISTGPMGNFRLDDDGFKMLSALGVVDCARLFGPAERNEYEELLFLAITNFAEGERAVSPRQKILSYVTALELFFNERTASTQAVVEGVAFLAGKNYNQRKGIIEQIERMYDRRSRVSHSGVAPKEIESDRAIVLDMILRMISLRGTFTTKEDIRNHIDRRRFSTFGDLSDDADQAQSN
jgi:hypothetical protein